jgi:alkyl hydroperoxide reductase subunit F
MILEAETKSQLSQYLQLMEGKVHIKFSAGTDEISRDMEAFLDEIAALTSNIEIEKTQLERTPSFSINRPGEETGITFAGIPLGHEFTSLILAILQVSGRPPKLDQQLIDQIKALKGQYRFETYASLSCHNCPDVVQALNLMSLLNPGITHTMIDGAVFKEEVEAKQIMAVPTVYLNGEFFESGRMSVEEILAKLGSGPDASQFENKEPYDVLIVGGGPAGASSAIYSARKGLRVGVIADRFGGQVLDTLAIENLITVDYTEGPKLAAALEEHVKQYKNVDIMKLQRAKRLEKKDLIEVELENGAVLKAKTVIISSGARWRNANVPGEKEFRNKGVAYCAHCDGPLYAGKHVAVIGGGNSGVEAAIDLAGIVKHVTLLARSTLRAEPILVDRVRSLSNVTVIEHAQIKEITGTDKVDGVIYTDAAGNDHRLEVQGVFVQIGTVPNTEWLAGTVELNQNGEIVVDKSGATSLPGVFAAGDCTDSLYKQIIVSMGSGATAALGAFDYLIRMN